MEAIGNPAKFASRFASDLQNIIGPESNRNIPPKQIVKGIAKFGGKIVPNALLGVIGSIGSMAGAISSSLTQLTQNDEQIRQQRQRTAIQPGNIEQGLTQGASSIGHGFVSGVTGLVNKPKEAYNVKKGKRDLIKGIGKGIVGLFTDPISGVLDAGKNVLIGIQNSADNLLNDQSNSGKSNFKFPKGGIGIRRLFPGLSRFGESLLI
ncbi:MAG: hypothetical protein EZS28_008953 [Streblomastix strix]|uniref:Uncharacterized protein n=1 Tax=Streblomastix strix TaxID=222440 RepID=A0A5J4WMP6_9EUKA|nr:MAG: hypothetical protein EZS28_008953 [Streblomastix strix]